MFLRKHTKKIVSGPQKCLANEALTIILVSDSERNCSFVMDLQIAMIQRNSQAFCGMDIAAGRFQKLLLCSF